MIMKFIIILIVFLSYASCSPAEKGGSSSGSGSEDAGDVIDLPSPDTDGGITINEALSRRRSVRSYSESDITMEELSQLLWSAQGITSPHGFRTAPSAGALYPIEIYVAREEGVFHYIPQSHSIEKVMKGDVRGGLYRSALYQSSVRDAPLSLIIVGDVKRTRVKYGERAERYVLIEGGCVAQNIALQAENLGLGTVVIGAFNDGEVRAVLNLPDDYLPVAMMPVGRK